MNGGMGMQGGMSGMQAYSSLQNLSGSEFTKQWVSQMLTMHEAKLSELQSAASTVTSTQLKTIINSAIPKIRMHRDALQKLNSSTGSSSSGGQ